MQSVRKRLTYANVMSSLAVFLVLAGGTAFAAAKLGKNTVGTKQLKNNAVTAAKIKNGSVTGAKLQLSSLGKVPSATTADSAKTATTANSADTANSANTANSATNATHAGSADNADATDGMHLGKLHFLTGPNAPPTTIFAADGLTLIASCSSEQLSFTATTSVPHSEIYESGNFDTTYKGAFHDDFGPGETEPVGANIGDGTQNEVQGQLVYSTPAGAVVTAQFSLNAENVRDGGGCDVDGTTQFS